jgi:hypothetical protein
MLDADRPNLSLRYALIRQQNRPEMRRSGPFHRGATRLVRACRQAPAMRLHSSAESQYQARDTRRARASRRSSVSVKRA